MSRYDKLKEKIQNLQMRVQDMKDKAEDRVNSAAMRERPREGYVEGLQTIVDALDNVNEYLYQAIDALEPLTED